MPIDAVFDEVYFDEVYFDEWIGDIAPVPFYWNPPLWSRINYNILVYDSNGMLLWEVKDVESATLDQRVNVPATVSFVCPKSTQLAMIQNDLDGPNDICVLRDGTPIFLGPVSLAKTTHGANITIQVDALDYMAALKGEYVELYDADAVVATHVAAILAQQVNSNPVVVGTIEPTTDVDITIDRAFCYDALTKLRDIVGGYLQVDATRKFNWRWNLTTSTGQQLRYRKNMLGVERNSDWLNFGNRLYIYGDGVDLTDAGWPTMYIEDTESQKLYKKIVSRKIVDTSFTSAATMLQFAHQQIATLAYPRMTYSVNVVNLADFGIDWEALSLGSTVRLIDEELDIDIEMQIVRVIYDLVQGQNIQVELAAVSLNIVDIIPGNYVL